MRRLRLLTMRHRTPATNRALGLILALNAGAINAGGFLLLHTYTSHMTGFASQLADGLVLGTSTVVLNAAGAMLAFFVGAAACAVIVNWGRLHRLHSVYALPLMLEAMLLFPFGAIGALTRTWSTPFALPATVMLLAFIMGLQNAVGSKTSGGSIRTTHMTGNITDLGMEAGKALLWSCTGRPSDSAFELHRRRLMTAGPLVLMFVLGGVIGAGGFRYVGFVWVIPMAAVLFVLALPPLRRDMSRILTGIKPSTKTS